MIVRILYSIAVCIICTFIILIFLDFRKQWKVASVFQRSVHKAPLITRVLLIAPEQVNVKNWQIGGASVYHLKTNTESKHVSFSVAAKDTSGSHRFWLKINGLSQFKGVDIESWRLLDNTNIRPGSQLRGFYFAPEAIPIPEPLQKFPRVPVFLQKQGYQVITTPLGSIKCEHSFAYVRSPDGGIEPLLELWATPDVRPLGIVRARWQDASLNLIQVDGTAARDIPPLLLAEFDRNTPLDSACTRCHADGIGGQSLKLGYINVLMGESLNLTTALFHHRQADLLKQKDFMHLHLVEKSRRSRKQGWLRFSSENGSFQVKTNNTGQVILSVDERLHQSHLTVQPSTGHLALEIRNEND